MTEPQESQNLFDLGVQYLDEDKNAEALACFDDFLVLEPDNYVAWHKRGSALLNLERFEEAIAAYDKALELEPDYHKALNGKGNALIDLGRYSEAFAAYDKALELKPDYHKAWNGKGIVLYDLSKYSEALAAFDKALELKPDYHHAWNNKGNALGDLGRYSEGLAAYDKALELKPDFHDAWNGKGNALNNLSRYSEAIAAYDKALELKPDFHYAWYNKGIALKNLSRYSEALAAYDKALELKPDYHYAWYNKGSLLYFLGRYEEALEAYKNVVNFKPDNAQAWYNLAKAFDRLRRYQDIDAEYEKMLARDRNPRADFYRGITLNKLGDYQKALECFNKAEESTQSPDWRIWQHRGWAIYELHGCDAAIEHWNQALRKFAALLWNPTLQKLEPDRLDPQEGQGVLYWQIAKASDRQNQQRDAKSSYKQALEFLTEQDFPEQHLEVLQELIELYQKLGNIREAEALTRNGIDLLEKLVRQTADSARKTELSQKFAGFNQRGVDRLAFSPYQQTLALELAEERKNLCLEWLKRGFVESSDGNFSSPKYGEIQTLLDSKTAALYWHLSPAAITVFLLRHNKAPQIIRKNQPLSFWRRDLGELWPRAKPTRAAYLAAREQLEEFQKWMKRWRENYDIHCQEQKQKASNNTKWREGLEEELKKLGEILDSDRLLGLLKGCDRLILIPHRELHLLPLHCLFDELKVSYLPSAKVGLDIASLHSPALPMTEGVQRLLSIEHPSDFMPYAAVESAFIGKQFSTRSLADDRATVDRLEKQLETPAEIFHFTGHGYHDSDRPSHSRLFLAKDNVLTLEHLFRLDNVAISFLVYLSSCETGMTGTEGLTNEFVGLASGFLAKGAKYVISTLWRVPEISTAVLTIRFYQLYKDGKTPVIALKEAQNWLRGATYNSLIELYQQLGTELKEDADAAHCQDKELRKKLIRCAQWLKAATKEKDAKIKPSDFRPYAHPYYWAGFIVTGKV